jgi:D-alanyl-D-alanine carboxypeptidase/D-alanyl-D-alanine-endopeptidase (penicillin-binding protein 4)
MYNKFMAQPAPTSAPLRRNRLLAVFLTILALAVHARAEDLPPAVAAALKTAAIPPGSVAVVVQNVDGSRPLIRHNAEMAMNPASTMKLVTTYAALELLGPAYTWKTEALTEKAPAGGVLDGNLYLRGSGDPRLALEQFWLLLRELRMRGVQKIAGDLVLDRSSFAVPAHDPAEFDNEPLRPYNVGPDALLVNLGSLQLTLRVAAERKAVEVVATTPSDSLRIDNRLRLTLDDCGDWRERVKPTVDGTRITLTGSFSAYCGERALNLAPLPADAQVEQLFRALWHELGGTLRGKVRAGLTPPDAQALVLHESPTLGEIVREINKYSNNVMARQVFLTLADERPATTEGAGRRIAAWLADKDLPLPELVLDNGSGLSRSERISADGLSALLLAAWKSPVMPELMASLPLAGIDGTMKKRLGNGAAAGRAHLKTGYLDGVRAIAGYVQDSGDRRWIVVFLINDPRSRLGKPAMDALLGWVAEH